MAGLSVRYATALFELSIESGNMDESFEQAVFLCETLKDADCRRVISHPHISTGEKMDFFNKSFAGSINQNLMGLVFLAINKNRESYLVPALDAFIHMVNDHKLRTTAQVVSASALSETQLSALKTMLSKKLGKQVDVALKIDPKVIGGLSIYVDGFLIDRTVKKQINNLKRNLHVV